MLIDAKGSEILSSPECMALLALAAKEEHIGRIGLSTDTAPIVIPLNFSLLGQDVVVRVGPGLIRERAPGQLVAFEVDHLDVAKEMAWSILVRGLATLIDEPSSELLTAAKPLVQEPGSDVLVIRSDVLTGRRFSLRTAAP